MCPHHLLPVIYRVSLAYIPSEKVLGISKLSRLARLMARLRDAVRLGRLADEAASLRDS